MPGVPGGSQTVLTLTLTHDAGVYPAGSPYDAVLWPAGTTCEYGGHMPGGSILARRDGQWWAVPSAAVLFPADATRTDVPAIGEVSPMIRSIVLRWAQAGGIHFVKVADLVLLQDPNNLLGTISPLRFPKEFSLEFFAEEQGWDTLVDLVGRVVESFFPSCRVAATELPADVSDEAVRQLIRPFAGDLRPGEGPPPS